MPTIAQIQLPPPKDWDEFERICFSVFKEKWKDENAQRNGKKGDVQNGVDIFGIHNSELNGVQCKGKELWPPRKLTISEINIEIEKAKSFQPPLKKFIITTTAPRNSKIQEHARITTSKLLEQGLFSVHVYSWEDITEALADYPHLIRLHYPVFFQSSSSEIAQEATEFILPAIKDQFLEIHQKLEPLYKGIHQKSIESNIKDEIDYAKNLIEKGKPETAVDYLLRLKNEKWHIATNFEKFRIISNIALSYLQMNDLEKASYNFIDSYNYDKDNVKAKLNYVLGKSLINEYKDAENILNGLIEEHLDNEEVYTLYILNTNDTNEVIQQIIPNDLQNKAPILYSLGHKLSKEQKFDEAIMYFRKAIDQDRNYDYLASLATTLLLKVIDPFTDKQNINTNETLTEIIDLLDEAFGKIKNTEILKYKYQWFVNRGTAKQIKGDSSGARKDFEITLEYNPNDYITKRNLALWEFEKGDREKAIKLLREIKDTGEVPEICLLLSDFLRIEKKFNDAESVIKYYIDNFQDPKFVPNAKAILEAIYVDQGLLEKAFQINKEREQDNPLTIAVTIDSAYLDKENGNEDLAKAKLTNAIGNVNSSTPYFEKKNLANALYDFKLYTEAINVYESFLNTTNDSTESRRLLNAYYKTGKFEKALKFCKSLRKIDYENKGLAELESHIYEDLGDNPNAIKTLKDYVDKYSDVEISIDLAHIYYRNKEYTRLDEILSGEIKTDDLQLSDRIRLAQLYSLRNFRDKFLNLIYETRHKFYSISEAHSHYVWLFMERKDKDVDLLNLSSIIPDSVALLKRGNEKKVFILENRPNSDLSKGEVNPSSPLYQKLIGHKKFDEINLSDNLLANDVWIVEDIKSKFIHALHESMTSFNRFFPEDKTLQQISVSDNIKETLSELFKNEDERKKNTQSAEYFYKQSKLPLSGVAEYLGRSILEVYRHYTYTSEIGIRCGDMKYARPMITYSEIKGNLILDIIALNSVINLGIEELIISSFKNLNITQSVQDDINQRIYEVDSYSKDGFFTIVKEDGQYFKSEVTVEQISFERQYLSKMNDFIKNNCKINSLNATIVENFEQYNAMKKVIGKSSMDTLLLAKQLNGYLYCDDLTLRSLGKNELKIEGVWTQYLLHILKATSIITSEVYNQLVIKLSLLNYKHTSINATNLIEAAKESNWSPTYPLTKLLETLNGGQSDELSSSVVASDFVFELWKQIVSNEKRNSLLNIVLSSLIKNRNVTKILDNFEINLSIKFKLMPIWLDEILNLISIWRRIHLS